MPSAPAPLPSDPKDNPVVVFAVGPDLEQAPTREMVERCRQHGAEALLLDASQDPWFSEHLQDPRMREHFPLLCIRGGLVGGLEVVRQLDARQQLGPLLRTALSPDIPSIALSREAAVQLRAALVEPTQRIRLTISAAYDHDLLVDACRAGDLELVLGDIPVVLDADSAGRAQGVAIDWVKTDNGQAFRVSNPNRPEPVIFVDRAWLEREGSRLNLLIIDARTAAEYAVAHIDAARLLDAALIDALESLDRETPLLFYCNGGIRSKKAAERYREFGFQRVYCLTEPPT